MEILILGVILLVLGVGATYIYDKHKDIKVAMQKNREANRAARPRFPGPQTTPAPKFKPSSEQPMWSSTTTTKTTTRKAPISQKKKLKGPVTNEDVSINSTLTVQELIDKIEQLKNKPGPKK